MRRFAISSVILSVTASLALVIAEPASAATTFGFTNLTGMVADVPAQGYKFGSIATLAETGTLGAFRFYAKGGGSPQKFVPVIYSVTAAGAPGSLLATGAEVSVPANKAAGWMTATMPAKVLSPGKYVLGLISGPVGTGASVYYTSQSSGALWNENPYPTASPTWGPINNDNVQWKFAVNYTPSGSTVTTSTTVAPTTSTTKAPTTSTTVAPTTTTTAPSTTTTTRVTTTTVPPSTTTTLPPPPSGTGSCPAFPAFPNKTCTGVPAGTALTDFSGTVTQDNAVISNVRITSRVVVQANNVTFRNCWISPAEAIAFEVVQGKNGLTLENCTFKSGSLIAPFSGLTLRRVLVDPNPGAYRPDGLVIGFSSIGHNGQNVLIEDSYISPQWGDGGSDPDHTDGLQFWGFGTISNVVLRHNYIDATNVNPDPTAVKVGACAFLADATYVNVTFEYNYCTNSAGGYFHLRLASNDSTGGHIIRGNRFANRNTTPVDLFRATPSVWSDNRYADNGELIAQPAIRG